VGPTTPAELLEDGVLVLDQGQQGGIDRRQPPPRRVGPAHARHVPGDGPLHEVQLVQELLLRLLCVRAPTRAPHRW